MPPFRIHSDRCKSWTPIQLNGNRREKGRSLTSGVGVGGSFSICVSHFRASSIGGASVSWHAFAGTSGSAVTDADDGDTGLGGGVTLCILQVSLNELAEIYFLHWIWFQRNAIDRGTMKTENYAPRPN